MSYIGNQVTSVPHIVDLFSGNASATSFGNLTRAPAGTAAIAVFISGVYKTPGIDYTLSGDTINFTVAPASGTNNIAIHHLGNGTTTQVPSDGSVTSGKLIAGAVSGNNMGLNAVSGNNIGTSAVSGNNIGIAAVSGNNIGLGAVSANQFSSSANAKIFSTGIIGSIIFGAY